MILNKEDTYYKLYTTVTVFEVDIDSVKTNHLGAQKIINNSNINEALVWGFYKDGKMSIFFKPKKVKLKREIDISVSLFTEEDEEFIFKINYKNEKEF